MDELHDIKHGLKPINGIPVSDKTQNISLDYTRKVLELLKEDFLNSCELQDIIIARVLFKFRAGLCERIASYNIPMLVNKDIDTLNREGRDPKSETWMRLNDLKFFDEIVEEIFGLKWNNNRYDYEEKEKNN